MLNTSMGRDVAYGEPFRKRIITQTRREQNRVAAKAYRQRQKEKLQSTHAKRRGIQELRPCLAPSVKESISASHNDINFEINDDRRQGANKAAFQNSTPPKSLQNSTARGESQHEAERLGPNNASSTLVPADSFIPLAISSSALNLEAYNLTLHQLPLLGAGECGNLDSSTTLDEAEFPDITLYETLSLATSDLLRIESSSNVSNENIFPDQGIGLLTFPNSIQEDLFQKQDPISLQYRVSEVGNIPSMQSDLLLSHPNQGKAMRIPTPSPVADPYTNYIQLWRGSAFTAGLYIAISVGFDVESIRSSEWSSPFYRPTTAADDPNTLLAAAQIPYAPASLQPTLPQLLFQHHAYIDLIPFPVFRARAITLASTSPPLVDLWDLKKDINAGLVCWNPGNGTNGGNLQPWDVRSWKAAPWFLMKWRMLIN